MKRHFLKKLNVIHKDTVRVINEMMDLDSRQWNIQDLARETGLRRATLSAMLTRRQPIRDIYLDRLLRPFDTQERSIILGTWLSETLGHHQTDLTVLVASDARLMAWMSGLESECTWVNKPWLEFSGLTMRQKREIRWINSVHPADRKRVGKLYISAFNARKNFSLICRIRHRSGSYRKVCALGAPRYDAVSGDFLGYFGTAIDLSGA